jgi:hypothetical protein
VFGDTSRDDLVLSAGSELRALKPLALGRGDDLARAKLCAAVSEWDSH